MKSTIKKPTWLCWMRNRQIITDVICYSFILLFIYAATTKLLDYQNFKLQLRKSPILTDFAGILVWMVPAIELVVALLLIIPRTILMGLFGALGLMSLFTVYIIAILNFSENIPCSCGGVLENMSWQEHLVFNIAFLCIAVLGILLQSKPLDKQGMIP